jgi:hypothetical protein
MNELTTQENINPGSLVALAIEKDIKPDDLGKLLEVYERHEAGKAKKTFFMAFSEFQKNCPSIPRKKSGWNDNYKYASFDDIIEKVKDMLTKYGFSYSFRQEEKENRITITCNLNHKDGHTESMSLTGDVDKSGGKNTIQATGSTVSYLKRYTFLGITGIATADEDDDGERANTGMGILFEQVIKLLTHTRVKRDFHFKEVMTKIPNEKYLIRVKTWCEKVIKNGKNKKVNPLELKRQAVLKAITTMKKGGNFFLTEEEATSFIDAIKKATTIKDIIEEHEQLLRMHEKRTKKIKGDKIKPPKTEHVQSEIGY